MELEDEEQGEEQQPRRPEPQQEPRLNGKVLYDIAGGTPHGRFAIGNGVIRAADIKAAATSIKFSVYAKHGSRNGTLTACK